MSQSREWTFGTHRARLESADVLVFQLTGPISLSDAHELVRVFQQAACNGPLYAVVRFSDTSSNKEVRAYIAQNLRARWLQGVVLSGAGPLQKASLKAVLISLYLTGWDVPVEFVDSEAQAHALIARLRLQAPRKARRAA